MMVVHQAWPTLLTWPSWKLVLINMNVKCRIWMVSKYFSNGNFDLSNVKLGIVELSNFEVLINFEPNWRPIKVSLIKIVSD